MGKKEGTKYFFNNSSDEAVNMNTSKNANDNTSSDQGSNIVSKETSRNRHNTNYNNTYAQAANLMSRHFTYDEEELDYRKTIPKSIVIFIICGALAFFIGPKYIVTYCAKYLSNSLNNIMPNLSSGSINTYALIMNSLIIGMLGFFYALFIYSGYNLIRKGYCLETFKETSLKIFGCAVMIALLIAIITQLVKVDLVTPIIKILSFNGALYKYTI